MTADSSHPPLPTAPPSVHLALCAVQVMFASLATCGKIVLRQLPPFAAVSFRTPMAAVVLMTLYLFNYEKVAWRDFPTLAVYAVFGIIANQLLFISGLDRTTATNAVVIGAIIPVFTVGVALLLRRERATAAKLGGLAVAFAGALAIVGIDRFETGGAHLVGNLLVVANSLSFSIYLVISRGLLARYRTLTVIAWTFFFGAIGVLPFGARDLIIRIPSLWPITWAVLVYVVLFPTVGTYFLNSFALKRAPSSLVAIYIYLQPILGALIAAYVLGERVTVSVLVGGALIALGIYLVNRSTLTSRTIQP
ncbi:MAG: DMT family transporter [Polyangia bacterium]